MRSCLALAVSLFLPVSALAADLGDPALFPLRDLHLQAEVAGPLAQVTVLQRFGNRTESPIEAVYTFPLPADAAVDAYELRIGERTIQGRVEKRETARALYEEARARGALAARLDQERPNVFTQYVANLLPGEEVEVELRFQAKVGFRDGAFELALPLVVGPRFHPGAPVNDRGDTDRVPDASRLSPPLAPPGTPTARAMIHVVAETGITLGEIASPSHELQLERTSSTSFETSVEQALANQDFVLRWTAASEAPEVSVLAHRDEGDGTFLLQLQPPAELADAEAAPRELVILVDSSCSMTGHPLATAKAVATEVLQGLRPGDTFQIINFSQAASSLAERPLPASQVGRGLAHLRAVLSGGGTMMTAGVRAALAAPEDPARLRLVLLLTDGYIGNEVEVLRLVNRHLGGARLFALGVGTAVNRYLLDELAQVGRGAVDYVRPDEDPSAVAARFGRRIDAPVLTDLVLEGDGLRDLEPPLLPDLFAGEPVVVTGRYDRPGPARLVVRGRKNGRPWSHVVHAELPHHEPRFRALGSAWARARIATLSRLPVFERGVDVEPAITELGLRWQLVTAYTSFVAVDRIARAGEPAKRVVQPLPVPAGVDPAGVGGRAAVNQAGPGVFGLGSRGSFGKKGAELSASGVSGPGGVAGAIDRAREKGEATRKARAEQRRPAAAPRLEIGEPSAKGALSAEAIARILAAARPAQERCVAERAARLGGFAGTITLELRLAAAGGRPTAVRTLEATFADLALERCLARRLRALVFPAAAGDTRAKVTLRLVP